MDNLRSEPASEHGLSVLAARIEEMLYTGLREWGSNGREVAPECSAALRKSSPSNKNSFDQASDQSSDAADVSEAEASSNSLRKLRDLISSADESSDNNASSIDRALRGLVDALIEYDRNNDPPSDCSTKSDATFAASSTERTKRKRESVEATTQPNDTPADPSLLDVAVKAMTLGILFGMKRSGCATEGASTTRSSGITSRAGGSSNLVEVANEMKAFLRNHSLRLLVAPALSGQEIQVQFPCSDDTGRNVQRSSSVLGSSGDEDAKKRQRNHEDNLRTAGKLGKSEEPQKRLTSASESPTELASGHRGHKRKATLNDLVRGAKRRSAVRLSPKTMPMPCTERAEAKATTSGREKFVTTRSVSILTSPFSDFSSTSKSSLNTLDKQNGFSVMARLNSNAWSQTSDVSGDEFETGSSKSGSAPSNSDFPKATTSGREKFGTTRSVSILTSPLSDFSSIHVSKSSLNTLDKQNGFGVMARLNSNAWSQTSDVSGEDFETGSSKSGSASSNSDFPTTNTSGTYSGSTSNPAESSTGKFHRFFWATVG